MLMWPVEVATPPTWMTPHFMIMADVLGEQYSLRLWDTNYNILQKQTRSNRTGKSASNL
jgi:hypothetical protein